MTGYAQLFSSYHILFQTSLFWLYIGCLLTDLISGNIRAWVTHDVDSSVGVRGTLKHLGLFSFVTIFLPSLVMYTGDMVIAQGVLLYFVYQYVISIIENLGLLGFSVPEGFADRFRRLGNDDDKEDKK